MDSADVASRLRATIQRQQKTLDIASALLPSSLAATPSIFTLASSASWSTLRDAVISEFGSDASAPLERGFTGNWTLLRALQHLEPDYWG